MWLFDIYVYCEMITTMNLVNTHHLMYLEHIF